MKSPEAVAVFSWLADAVVVLHAAFIAFVVCGGLLVWRWRRAAWVHLPAAAWGAIVEILDWPCPLTPLERRLREAGGGVGSGGDFVERALAPLVYPEGLTRTSQIVLGLAVVGINAAVYGMAWARHRSRRGAARRA